MGRMPIGTVTFIGVAPAPPHAPLAAAARDLAIEWLIAFEGYRFEAAGISGAAFESPGRAIEAAVGAREGLRDQVGGPGIGLAVHAGRAELRDLRYVGPTMTRLAALLAAAHGGQTLVSSAAYELARDSIAAASVLDLGEHRLRDLQHAARIYQLGSGRFPTPRGIDRVPNNLPTQCTTFVGREDEVRQEATALAGSRLLSLTGSEGTGKTRLALQLAALTALSYPDGVWLVELSRLPEPEAVPEEVARVLSLRLDPRGSTAAALSRWLEPRVCLLVLDDYSAVPEAVAQLAQTALAAAPGLHLIATGSQPLGLAGERTMPVRPFAVPRAIVDATSVPALPQYAAVQLFLDRAAESLPGFQASNDNLPAIAQVCQRLDGIALAIELAAARVAAFGEDRLSRELEAWFERRTGGRSVSLPRHQTLRAAVEWSGSLLSEMDRRLLGRLSVFAGRFDSSVAQAICADDRLSPGVVGAGIERLAGVGLIARAGGGVAEMSAPVRSFALDLLLESGEAETIRDRHLDWCLDRVRDAYPSLVGPMPAATVRSLEPLRDDLGGALAWGLSRRRPRTEAVELAARLAMYWLAAGEIREGRRWLSRAASVADAPVETAALAQYGLGVLAWRAGDQVVAETAGSCALDLASQLGDGQLEARALNCLGLVALNGGRHEDARELLGRSLERKRGSGANWDVAITIMNLGEVERAGGRMEAAERLYAQALGLLQGCAATCACPNVVTVLENLAFVALAERRRAVAADRFREALVCNRSAGDPMGTAIGLAGMACVAAAAGEGARSARMFGACAAQLDRMGARLEAIDERVCREHEALARASLSEHDWASAWADGRSMQVDEALAEAGDPDARSDR